MSWLTAVMYQFLMWEALISRSEANARLDWSAVPYQMCGLFNVTTSGKNHRNYKRKNPPKTYAEWANCKSKFHYHLHAQLMTSRVQGAIWLADVRVIIKIKYVQYSCYYLLCCRIIWYTCIPYMRMRFFSQCWNCGLLGYDTVILQVLNMYASTRCHSPRSHQP